MRSSRRREDLSSICSDVMQGDNVVREDKFNGFGNECCMAIK